MSPRDPFEAQVMSAPIVDSAVNSDVIGAWGLEWDGARCADCGTPLPADVRLCDGCTPPAPAGRAVGDAAHPAGFPSIGGAA